MRPSLITYPYDNGMMKEFALIYATQPSDLVPGNMNILDPIALTHHTLYFNTLEEMGVYLCEVVNGKDRVLFYRVFSTRLSLDVTKWASVKLK